MTACAILGPGNIGTDLLLKIARRDGRLRPTIMVGIDPSSAGLARARELGLETSAEGLDGLLASDAFADVEIVFDATSAAAHTRHADALREHGKQVVDLTPAAVGPYVVPPVNLGAHLAAPNVNMVTCGGQATIPMVAAVADVLPVRYAEIVASIASRSAGPGTRANIDEFTQTTARGIEVIGRAERGKAIIILNPAEPPLVMRNTVFAFAPLDPATTPEAVAETEAAIAASLRAMAANVATYVPGYRLVQDPVFERFGLGTTPPLAVRRDESWSGVKVTVFLEVEGAGDHLPTYAGNLDIMTSAARQVGELLAEHRSAR